VLAFCPQVTNCCIAIDENTAANGCMRVVRGSHRLGRLEHGVYGSQTGAEPRAVGRAMAVPGSTEEPLLMRPGDICWWPPAHPAARGVRARLTHPCSISEKWCEW
jgi:ectoine hydroxylase-related dioxygenase (phytanoyl-CoA dioxygenase family)